MLRLLDSGFRWNDIFNRLQSFSRKHQFRISYLYCFEAKKNVQMRGVQNLRNEAYIKYAAVTKVVAQRSSWAFFEAV